MMPRHKIDIKLPKHLSFTEVAKKSNLTGLTTKKFRDNAFSALRKAGYGATEAKSIISGSKKITSASLKKVFDELHQEKVIKKGPSAVADYVKEEKAKKERIIRLHLRERADEILKEKKAEEEIKKQSQQKTTSAKSSQSAPATSSGGFGPSAPSPFKQGPTTSSATTSSLPDWRQPNQNWEQPSSESTMPNQPAGPENQPSASELQQSPVPAKEDEQAPEDMVID